jgi:hypothetical protein
MSDPFLPIYRELLTVEQLWSSFPPDLSREEEQALNDANMERWRVAMRKAYSVRPTTQEGLAALTHIMWMEAGPREADSSLSDQQVARLEDRLMAHVWQTITGLDGLPRPL